MLLDRFLERVASCSPVRWQGRVNQVSGQLVESQGPFCSVGEVCEIISAEGKSLAGEIVGFRGGTVLSMPLDRPAGIRFGDRVVASGMRPALRVSDDLLGRVIDGCGAPLDNQPKAAGIELRPLDANGPLPLEREPVHEAISCGVRAIDGLLTCGLGQRVGIFGGSGVGKTTLIGMMARNTNAELTVLALVGERGREVRHFLEDALGEDGRRRSVVVVSTSDQAPLLRIRAALAATTVAEYFANQGRNVLLVVDSLTRLAMAQREIGLAAGEPPTAKGYTPSAYTLLARLIERAGKFRKGSITAFYTVLMEGDDQYDPLVDSSRALLDGHIVLDRRLASRNHYPPIAVVDSISRLMSSVTSAEHMAKASRFRRLLSTYIGSEDLIRVGAYQKGSDSEIDNAIAAYPALVAFLQQSPNQICTFTQTSDRLMSLEI